MAELADLASDRVTHIPPRATTMAWAKENLLECGVPRRAADSPHSLPQPRAAEGRSAMIDWHAMSANTVNLGAVFRISVISLAVCLHRVAGAPEQRRHGTSL
jgi:hypothetical protein